MHRIVAALPSSIIDRQHIRFIIIIIIIFILVFIELSKKATPFAFYVFASV
tara:strand:+ start:5236 stop:5388 length:153 start_codon:yes stop_codon:yes gene_type:complete